MSSPDEPERHLGKLVRVNTVVLPPIPIDFSKAPRAPGPRSRGKLIKLPGKIHWVPIDCSPRPKVWLEITVSFFAESDPATVEALTLTLIQAAHDAAPELGLTYDKGRSRVVGEDIVIALVPQHPAGVQERLSAVLEQLRKAAAQPGTMPVKRLDADLCTAA